MSLLCEEIGLPSSTIFPVIAKRGENGIPLADQAKALFAEDPQRQGRVGTIGKRAEWFPATIKPLLETGTKAAENIPRHTGELLGKFLVDFIVGNLDQQLKAEADPGNVGHPEQAINIVSLATASAFQSYTHAQQTLDILDSAITNMPAPTFTAAQEREIALQLNGYLTRLEALNRDDLENLFWRLFSSTQ